MILEGSRVLVTGGTGSLGNVLIRRVLAGEMGTPEKVIVLSRDEAKQHQMRLDLAKIETATDEIIYHNFQRLLEFRIGDVRDFHTIATTLRGVDIVFNAAALKQVPTCEYFPFEAVRTNVEGPHNIVRAIAELDLPVHTVTGISTDKACKPINVMGMTKALQERVFLSGNLLRGKTRFICVRYGNVLASRGSVIPLFLHQIRHGGPVTLTDERMTRFLLSLDDAVDTIFSAVREGIRGETFVPRAPTARVLDVAHALIGKRSIEIKITGIRPGEKVHEVLVSEEESPRTVAYKDYLVIRSILPELYDSREGERALNGDYSSARGNLSLDELTHLLHRHGFLGDESWLPNNVHLL